MYLMVCTKPRISHVVGVVTRYMENPRKQHWETVKWVLRYLKGRRNDCIIFDNSSDEVCSYVDSYFVDDLDIRRSTSGYVFTLVGDPQKLDVNYTRCFFYMHYRGTISIYLTCLQRGNWAEMVSW